LNQSTVSDGGHIWAQTGVTEQKSDHRKKAESRGGGKQGKQDWREAKESFWGFGQKERKELTSGVVLGKNWGQNKGNWGGRLRKGGGGKNGLGLEGGG